MSDRDVALYIEDMLEFAGRASEYARELTEESLTIDRMRYDAILRNIELIGEAAIHVPESVRRMAPDVPWRKIVGARTASPTATWASRRTPSGPSWTSSFRRCWCR